MAVLEQSSSLLVNLRRRLVQDQAQPPDLALGVLTSILVIIGVMMIYSVSVGPNVQGGRDDPFNLVERHVLFLLLAVAALVVVTFLDYHVWLRLAVPLMIVTVLSLIAVLLTAEQEQEATRWLFNGSIQPGEFAKLVSIIYIAAWLSSKGSKLRHLVYGLVPFSILVGLVAGLIWLQPNYSTAILITVTAFTMFFVAGADLIQFTLTGIIGTVSAVLLVTQSHRAMARFALLSVDPFKVPSDQVWQLAQTLTALASGGLFGKGLGTGGGQYGYVPLAHSDGIFAIWGEETGLIGTSLLLLVFLLFAYRGFQIASKAPDDFGRVLASGVTFWIIFQAFINIGVVTQLVPFTGQPLPFISYGGSSLLTSLVGVGLLLSISRGKPLPVVVKSVPRTLEKTVRGMKENHASFNYGWRNGGTRLSTPRRVGGTRRRTRARPEE